MIVLQFVYLTRVYCIHCSYMYSLLLYVLWRRSCDHHMVLLCLACKEVTLFVTMHVSTKRRLIDKFNHLKESKTMGKQHEGIDQTKWVVNLSPQVLTDAEQRVLCWGLIFVPAPWRIPNGYCSISWVCGLQNGWGNSRRPIRLGLPHIEED